jgi:hypothetical protein
MEIYPIKGEIFFSLSLFSHFVCCVTSRFLVLWGCEFGEGRRGERGTCEG